jgi:hypothetical protein
MSAQLSRRNCRKPVHHFPSDPHYANVILKNTASEISCLGRDVFLSTAVLDFIFQSAVLPPDVSEERVPPMIGSLGSVAFISSANLTASYKQDQVSTIETWDVNQDIIFNLCITYAPLLNPKPHPRLPQWLILPVVKDAHFFVGCFDFSVNDPDFFTNISFYDSLDHARSPVPNASTALDIVRQVNLFFNTYLIHKEKFSRLQQTDTNLLRCVDYKVCPFQTNGHN